MKILFCTSIYDSQAVGPANFVRSLVQMSKTTDGFDITVISEDTQHEDKNVIRIPVNLPKMLHPPGNILRNRKYFRAVKTLTGDKEFDCIVFNNASLAGLTAYRLTRKIPVIGFVNDDNHLLGQHGGTLTSALYHNLQRWLEKRGSKHVTAVIVNSLYLKGLLERNYAIPASRVHVLYKGVDLDAITFQPERNFDRRPLKVLFVKNDWRRGGLPELVNALANLSEYTFQLTVIGPLEHYKDEILHLASGVSNIAIDCIGPASQARVFSEMGNHHMLCIPSKREALGVANMEGMAHGIPVITSSMGGVPEVTENEKSVWVVDPHAIQSIADGIRACITRREERMQKSLQGRKIVEQRFGRQLMFRNLKSLLERITDEYAKRT